MKFLRQWNREHRQSKLQANEVADGEKQTADQVKGVSEQAKAVADAAKGIA